MMYLTAEHLVVPVEVDEVETQQKVEPLVQQGLAAVVVAVEQGIRLHRKAPEVVRVMSL